MLYREIIAVCSEIHTKHKNTLCRQNVELFNIKSGGIYSYLFTLTHKLCTLVYTSLTFTADKLTVTKLIAPPI